MPKYSLILQTLNRCFSFVIFSLLLLLFSIPGNEEDVFAAEKIKISSPGLKNKNSPLFLWRIDSPQAKLYLLGSIHVASKHLYPLDARIIKAFRESDILVVETRMDRLTQQEKSSLINKYAQYPSGKNLSGEISEKQYELIQKKFQAVGLSLRRLQRYKPWFLALNYSMVRVSLKGYQAENGIDEFFLFLAQGSKKILELENPGDQLNALAGLSQEVQLNFLFYSLQDESYENMDRMFRTWQNGDTGALEKLILTPMRNDTKLRPLYDRLFTQRNRRMAEKISHFLKRGGKYFVVVGAGHLVGQKNIFHFLSGESLKIEQISE